MTKHTEVYYKAEDGKRFETEEECRAYETEEERYMAALEKKRLALGNAKEAEKEIAVIEYARFKRNSGYALPMKGIYRGLKYDWVCITCPHCGEYVGNWGSINLGLKVDKGVYKCEKCGGFFSYS